MAKVNLFERVMREADVAVDVERYRPIIAQAAADYASAAASYREAAAEAREAGAEVEGLKTEQAYLQQRVSEFDAGRLVMPDEEYLAALDKLRLLGGKINAQAPLVARREKDVRDEVEKLNHVAAGARRRLIDAVRADAAAIEKAAQAELEKVLR